MSIDPAIFRAMVENGATPEMLLAVVEAAAAVDEQRKERKRAGNAARQKRFRERHAGDDNDSNALQPVTERDPPNDNISNPPVIPQDETIVSSTPKPVRGRKSAGMVPLPDGWEPVLTDAAQEIVNRWPPGWLAARVAEFRDHATDKGRRSKDWQAAFRTWITKADTWQTQENRNGTRTRQPAVQQAAHGLRGPRPDPAIDLLRQAQAERAAGLDEDEGGDSQTWPSLPSYLAN